MQVRKSTLHNMMIKMLTCDRSSMLLVAKKRRYFGDNNLKLGISKFETILPLRSDRLREAE